MDTVNTELIRGHVDTIILNVLQEQDRYGYEILELISKCSDGRYEIKQPTLYSCLKRLEKQGFISSYYGDESNGGRRKYYKLDKKGEETLTKDQREWEYSRTIIDKLLSDKQIDLKTVIAPFEANDLRPLTKRVKAYEPNSAEKEVVYQPVYIEVPEKPSTIVENNNVSKNIENKAPTDEQLIAESILYAKSSVQENTPLANNELPTEKLAQQTTPTLSVEEQIKMEQRVASASKLLNLGNFSPEQNVIANDSALFTANATKTSPAEKTLFKDNPNDTIVIPSATTSENKDEKNINYREVFAALYDKKSAAPSADEEKEALLIDAVPTKAKQFADMKQSLLEEGFKLKQYSKSNSANYYYMNYFYCNKIARDTSLIAYLAFVIELLLIFIGKKVFGYSGAALLIIGAIATIIPIFFTVKWITNPTKRIKANYNFNTTIINSFIIYIVIVAISTIVNMVSPSIGIDFTSGTMYVPYILAINIPLGATIYNILYRTKNYHLK